MQKKIFSTLRKLLYSDESLKNTYQMERKMISRTHPAMKPYCKMWDYKIKTTDYEIPIRLYKPSAEGDYPVMIFFHGGGFVTGDINSYTNTCVYMSQATKCCIIAVDYRLAPEYPFPTGLEDCYTVVKEIIRIQKVLNHPLDKVTLIGDSAGANLAAAVSLMARDRDEFKVDRQILLYPVTNSDHSDASPYPSVIENGKDYLLTQKRMIDYIDLYVTDKAHLKDPYVAPILADNFTNQPETLIITAEYDLLRDEGEDYGRKLYEAHNDVTIYRIQNAVHGFITLMSLFPEVRASYKIINQFLQKGNSHVLETTR